MTFLARNRTIESITRPITNIVSQLNAHAEFHANKAANHRATAEAHKEQAAISGREVTMAAAHASNIATVFSL